MTTSTTSSVYLKVIEDVINKVRDEFVNNGGPGEGVLNELQGLWETKMMQAGVIYGLSDRSSAAKPTPGGPITPVHDLNVPYEGTEEYETPTAELLFPPTPAQTPMQTSLPGSENSSMYNIPTGPSEYSTPANDSVGNNELKAGRPSPYMQPPSPWMNQRAPLDVNVAYVEGRDEVDRGASHQSPTQDFFMMSSGKRKRDDIPTKYQNGGYIPQQDGAGDALSESSQLEVSLGDGSLSRCDTDTTASKEILAQLARSSTKIPQLDGPIPDPYDDVLSTPNIYNYQGVVNEDYNIVNTPATNELQAGTPAPIAQNDTGDDDEDEPLNENDDDEFDDVDQGEELNTQHLVLAQFDKVTRTKSRWKCTLKDGIMHINNKDILFNKATGEFDF
ncbi:Transcription initiation factor IIA subunit 1 [Tripterygium wilfordii]|uniref:Transcription initiation factor IIA subunit 1 n=1 Tax=Tripterygium wilfordii TaxID=458696 RepID=A0A7J7C0I0_TRIWF|nr:transcription initiation factor IIA subunit 1-like [Tripterygium wilfordii]KAF5727367.1 Transcription initiation factor IIA subunit 1 [Tripterygium wilfordii]